MENRRLFISQVLEPFLKTIMEKPNNMAFCINETFYQYKMLGECISKIRNEIISSADEEKYFGLVVNDDIETYASIYALWFEGKAYIPLHPTQPLDRCEELVSQMNISVILDSSNETRYSDHRVINTSELPSYDGVLSYDSEIDESDQAYILFTSGSTGKPKGVMISRANVGAFIESFWQTGIELTERDKCLQCFDLTFDVSVQSFIVPLVKGACAYTIPHSQIKYTYVYGLLEDHHITFGAVAPSMLRYLRPYFDEIDAPWMRYCILTAEASPLDLAMEWHRCIPNARLFNFYGPTEATIYCTYYELDIMGEPKTLNGMLSIGHPLKNVSAIIIDEEGNLVMNGEKGELCVSGSQITPGYWNNPEQNERAFFEKSVDGIKHRFYHTGDLCYFDSEKTIMLYGRKDSQVKIQGYRVELGEIEFHTREYLKGSNAVVLPYTNENGNTDLALFIEGQEINTLPLIDHLKSKMPFYMIPGHILFEKEFPLNSNSKVDKITLKKRLQ